MSFQGQEFRRDACRSVGSFRQSGGFVFSKHTAEAQGDRLPAPRGQREEREGEGQEGLARGPAACVIADGSVTGRVSVPFVQGVGRMQPRRAHSLGAAPNTN
jgi:hypothetical protein